LKGLAAIGRPVRGSPCEVRGSSIPNIAHRTPRTSCLLSVCLDEPEAVEEELKGRVHLVDVSGRGRGKSARSDARQLPFREKRVLVVTSLDRDSLGRRRLRIGRAVQPVL